MYSDELDNSSARAESALTSKDLIQRALTAADDDAYWDYVSEVHRRGDLEAFETARDLLVSESARERELAADLLAQLNSRMDTPPEERRFRLEAAELLLQRLPIESDRDALESVIMAFGHLDVPNTGSEIVRFAAHPDPGIREAVAYAVCGSGDDVVATLRSLTRDVDRDVRSWATFGLALQQEADSDEVRTALRERTADEDEEIREEATLGLARRGDTSVGDRLLKMTEAQDPHSSLEEAVIAYVDRTGDSRFCSYLCGRRRELLEQDAAMYHRYYLAETLDRLVRECGPA